MTVLPRRRRDDLGSEVKRVRCCQCLFRDTRRSQLKNEVEKQRRWQQRYTELKVEHGALQEDYRTLRSSLEASERIRQKQKDLLRLVQPRRREKRPGSDRPSPSTSAGSSGPRRGRKSTGSALDPDKKRDESDLLRKVPAKTFASGIIDTVLKNGSLSTTRAILLDDDVEDDDLARFADDLQDDLFDDPDEPPPPPQRCDDDRAPPVRKKKRSSLGDARREVPVRGPVSRERSSSAPPKVRGRKAPKKPAARTPPAAQPRILRTRRPASVGDPPRLARPFK